MSEHKHKWLYVQEMLTVNGRRAVATCDHGCQLVGDKIIEELNKVTQLEELLKDVPGDTLEQKIQCVFHELEQAHKRIVQLEANLESETAQSRTKCKAYRTALKQCEIHTVAVANTLNKQCAQREAALQIVLGHSNCYCDECKELAKKYWVPKFG